MNTKILSTNENDIKTAAQIIRDGGLCVLPTETVYGLGANALDEKAAAKIYSAKGRPSDNPLIIHIAEMKSLELITEEIVFALIKSIGVNTSLSRTFIRSRIVRDIRAKPIAN